MAHYLLENGLTRETLQRIRQKLPALDLDTRVDFARVEPDLSLYFQTYGFAQLSHADRAAYSLGSIDFDGRRVATHCWRAPQSAATVCVIHGLFDHVGLFLDVVDFLLGLNYSVVAIDLPGHGLSDGSPAEIDSFDEYGAVIATVLEQVHSALPPPFYALGQSTGCAALLNYVLAARGQRFSKLVLFAPLLQPQRFGWVSFLHTLLHRFLRSVARTFRDNSHNAHFNTFLQYHDPLQSHSIAVNWIGAMRDWIARFPLLAAAKLPTLIIQGDDDHVVEWKVNIPQITAKLPGARVEMIAGGMHHLANEDEAWRGRAFELVREFLE